MIFLSKNIFESHSVFTSTFFPGIEMTKKVIVQCVAGLKENKHISVPAIHKTYFVYKPPFILYYGSTDDLYGPHITWNSSIMLPWAGH